jgi:hypothetical protein
MTTSNSNLAAWKPRTSAGAEAVKSSVLAKTFNVPVEAIWFQLVRKESIEPHRLCALVKLSEDGETPVEVTFRREVLLNLIESIASETETVELSPKELPRGYELYLRTTSKKMNVPPGAKVVIMEDTSAFQELLLRNGTGGGSGNGRGALPKSVASVKSASVSNRRVKTVTPQPAAAVKVGAVDAQQLIEGVNLGGEAKASIENDSAQRTTGTEQHQNTASSFDPANPLSTSGSGLLETTNYLRKTARDHPLKEAKVPKSLEKLSSIELDGQSWFRYHPHVLSTVIYPTTTQQSEDDDSALPQAGAADLKRSITTVSSKVAAFAIDGTLFKTDLFRRGAKSFELLHPSIPSSLRYLQELGYRIVLFASYPSLHHAGRDHLVEKTSRIVEFFKAHCPTVTATVLLSTASSFCDSRYSMPDTGLWECFVLHCNGGIRPSLTDSFYVGNMFDPLTVRKAKKPRLEEAAHHEFRPSSGTTPDEGSIGGVSPTGAAASASDSDALGTAGNPLGLDVDQAFAERIGIPFWTSEDFYANSTRQGW